MKIQILSDLHHEFRRKSTRVNALLDKAQNQRKILAGELWAEYAHLEIVADSDADVIVLAGDIDLGLRGLYWADVEARAHDKPVIYISGNHEYYHGNMLDLLQVMRDYQPTGNLHFLQDNALVIDDTRFLGTTLWTDFKLYGETNLETSLFQARVSMNDFLIIDYGDEPFLPETSISLFEASLSWLKTKLSEPFSGKTVVITHHAPLKRPCHPQYVGGALNPAFQSDLEDLIKQPVDLWIFGHTHWNMQETINDTAVVSNQKGYPNEAVGDFSPTCVISV